MSREDQPSVGLFWFVLAASKPTLLHHRCTADMAEIYGDFLTCPHGHYEIWETWRAGHGNLPEGVGTVIAMTEYEEWPRGRIVFNRTTKRHVLYADRRILRAGLQPEILTAFAILSSQVDIRTDEHYLSARDLEAKSLVKGGIK
jgi:hypothetical protein